MQLLLAQARPQALMFRAVLVVIQQKLAQRLQFVVAVLVAMTQLT
jgi:hypothetical protein